MNVGIYESGEDESSGSVNHRSARGRGNVAIDAGDGFVFAIDIGLVALAGSNDLSVLDQQGHKLDLENNREWTRINSDREWTRIDTNRGKNQDEPQIDADLRR